MSKAKKNTTTPQANKKPAVQPKKQTEPAKKQAEPKVGFFNSKYANLWLVLIISFVTYLFNNACLQDQFTNWDDPGYLLSNPFVKDLSAEGIKNIFMPGNYVMGNYHPLTILSYAIEYSYVHLDPWLYHFDSLILYIINTVLVFWFVLKLTRNNIAALITALLFGLHPMHIESVAWVAGRKDVLYGVFFIGACITWTNYLRAEKKQKYYMLTLLLFILSLLSKPVAVTLPLTLFLIDYFEKREWARGWQSAIFLDKIPFIILSIICGIISVIAQSSSGALSADSYNIADRLLLGSYALITYLWKAIAPIALTNFYPYPVKLHGHFPITLYIYPFIGIALLFVLWKFARRNRIIVFGALFFLVNIVLLLQFIPVGAAIVADRYSYIPYIGFFFIAGWYVAKFLEKNNAAGKLVFIIMLSYCTILGYMSQERCKAWYDTISLWRDAIEKNGDQAANAYNNLGFEYYKRGESTADNTIRKTYFDSAAYLLNKATLIEPGFVNPYIDLGDLYRSLAQYDLAKKNLDIAIKLSPKDPKPYLGKAIIYSITQKFDSAGYCFRKSLQIEPFAPETHSSYGNYLDMTGKRDSAIIQYGIAIQQNPDIPDAYLNRARAYQRGNNCDNAIKDFNTYIRLMPDAGDAYYCRAQCLYTKGNKAAALSDVQKAISLKFTAIDPAFYNQLKQ